MTDPYRNSQELFEQIIENLLDLVALTDLEGTYTYVGKSHKILGYESADLLGRNVMELVHPEDFPSVMAEFTRSLEAKEARTVEYRYRCADGSYRWLQTHGKILTNDQGIPEQLLFSTREISQLRELEQVNEERKQYLEGILEATPSAVLSLDSQNRVKEWNRSAEELFHYSKDEVAGRPLDEIISQKKEQVYQEATAFSKQVMSGKPLKPTEVVRYTKEGEARQVIAAGSPIIINGVLRGTVATYTDITRLKEKEMEVRSLLQEKEQLLKEVHHRIKNHMNTISSIISLRTNRRKSPEVREALEEIGNKISLMQNIYQFLYLGEDVETIAVSAFLSPLFDDIRETYLDGRHISLEADIEDIEVSSKMSLPVGIIVTELINNAIKYAFPGLDDGRIFISISIDKEESRYLRIEVSDNGIGMAAAVAKEEQYGFGLTLVDAYTKQFSGSMEIEAGEGTVVRVLLMMAG
jgi:PAS domain S-box-containing protein